MREGAGSAAVVVLDERVPADVDGGAGTDITDVTDPAVVVGSTRVEVVACVSSVAFEPHAAVTSVEIATTITHRIPRR